MDEGEVKQLVPAPLVGDPRAERGTEEGPSGWSMTSALAQARRRSARDSSCPHLYHHTPPVPLWSPSRDGSAQHRSHRSDHAQAVSVPVRARTKRWLSGHSHISAQTAGQVEVVHADRLGPPSIACPAKGIGRVDRRTREQEIRMADVMDQLPAMDERMQCLARGSDNKTMACRYSRKDHRRTGRKSRSSRR